jgi:hypothetical protein
MADEQYKHILLNAIAATDKYKNPQGGGGEFKIYTGLTRYAHGNNLIADLEKTKTEFANQVTQEEKESFEFQPGMKITFESWEGFELKFESRDTNNNINPVRLYKSKFDSELAQKELEEFVRSRGVQLCEKCKGHLYKLNVV